MLYTVISEYDVFCSQSEKRNYMDVDGGKLEYIGFGRNKRVVGLFSTDPTMYLKKDFEPGKRIKTR